MSAQKINSLEGRIDRYVPVANHNNDKAAGGAKKGTDSPTTVSER